MCSSFDFIERQALEMCEMIRENSLYRLVRIEFSGGRGLELSENMMIENVQGIITKVILEDKDGTIYSIEPNSIGYSFAKGEITYKEYKRKTKRDTLQLVFGFFLITGF